jgi:hypothetical protein
MSNGMPSFVNGGASINQVLIRLGMLACARSSSPASWRHPAESRQQRGLLLPGWGANVGAWAADMVMLSPPFRNVGQVGRLQAALGNLSGCCLPQDRLRQHRSRLGHQRLARRSKNSRVLR